MSLPAAKAAPWYTAPATAPAALAAARTAAPPPAFVHSAPSPRPSAPPSAGSRKTRLPSSEPMPARSLTMGPAATATAFLISPKVSANVRLSAMAASTVSEPSAIKADVVVDGEAALADGGREVGPGALAEERDGVGGGVGAGLDGLEPLAEDGRHVLGGHALLRQLAQGDAHAADDELGVDALALPLAHERGRGVEVVPELAQRCPELDHQAHQLVDPDAGRLGRAEDLVERDLLVLGCHRPVAEEADDVARAVDEVELRDARELDRPLGQALEVVAGEPETGVEGGHDRGRAADVLAHPPGHAPEAGSPGRRAPRRWRRCRRGWRRPRPCSRRRA